MEDQRSEEKGSQHRSQLISQATMDPPPPKRPPGSPLRAAAAFRESPLTPHRAFQSLADALSALDINPAAYLPSSSALRDPVHVSAVHNQMLENMGRSNQEEHRAAGSQGTRPIHPQRLEMLNGRSSNDLESYPIESDTSRDVDFRPSDPSTSLASSSSHPVRSNEHERRSYSEPKPLTQDPRQDSLEDVKYLKKLLSDSRSKEMQLMLENRRLEGQISELRLMNDKWRRELLDITSKAALIQRDELEEKARLMAEIRAAKEDVNLYGDLLLPLLAEYGLEPVSRDPHSVASGVKALVQHFRDQRRDIVASWHRPEGTSRPTSPGHAIRTWGSHDHDTVPPQNRPFYVRSISPASPISRHLPVSSENRVKQHFHQVGYESDNTLLPDYNMRSVQHQRIFSGGHDNVGVAGGESYDGEETNMEVRHPQFHDDSLHSNEDDYVPYIKDLYVEGEAIVGNTVCAYGFQENGAMLCIFQWFRHYPNGTCVNIAGAAQPTYTITADDIGSCLSLECTPIDDRNRKGETLQVFVDDKRPVTSGS